MSFCYRTVPDSLKYLRAPVKKTGNGLTAGFQLSYRKIYGYFLQCGGAPVLYISVTNGQNYVEIRPSLDYVSTQTRAFPY